MAVKWISVKDRLPEVGKIIAWGQTRSYKNELRSASAEKCEYNSDGEWLLSGNYYLENVTHWQPLPDPPAPDD
jgi:hypothetical protein